MRQPGCATASGLGTLLRGETTVARGRESQGQVTTTSSSAPIGPFGGQGGQAGEQNTELEAGESLDAAADHQNPRRSHVNALDCGNESCEGDACATGAASDP